MKIVSRVICEADKQCLLFRASEVQTVRIYQERATRKWHAKRLNISILATYRSTSYDNLIDKWREMKSKIEEMNSEMTSKMY